MRLFVCEFITGGGLHDKALPDGLVREGNMMIEAVLKDFLEMGVTDIMTTRDVRLKPLSLPVEQIAVKGGVYHLWQSCMNNGGSVLLIAPESEGILFNLTLMAEQADCTVLGSASISVQRTSSKTKTTNLLLKNKIPCIETMALGQATVPKSDNGWVIKPDDGVGAEDCYFCRDRSDLEQLTASIDSKNFLIQRFITGIPASLSMICDQGRAQLLACNKQLFSFNAHSGKGVLKGLVVNGLLEQWTAFDKVAQDIAKADSTLRGYVGVDLIVTETGCVVVEINPRLTTAYVGLARLYL